MYISMSKRPRGTSTPTWSKVATASPVAAPAAGSSKRGGATVVPRGDGKPG
jgi:hypothetical protein